MIKNESARYNMDSQRMATVVLGSQWGDEGKGKLVDLLCLDADVVCRAQVRGAPLSADAQRAREA